VIPQDFGAFQPISFEKVQIAKVQIQQYDAINDVALLKLDAGAASAVPSNLLGDDAVVELGASCAFFGFPFSDAGLHVRHVAASVISAKVITSNGTRQYQLDAMIHEGCSGGPLFDRDSQKIIGIVSGRFSPTGNSGGVFVGNRAIGTDSSISFATCVSHGLALIEAERQNARI
jgi:serine protease Do